MPMSNQILSDDAVNEIDLAAGTVMGAGFNLDDVIALIASHRLLAAQVKALHAALHIWKFGPRPPYPFCRTPEECAGRGYCNKDPACDE